MSDIKRRIIDVRAAVLGDNELRARAVRRALGERGVLLVGLRGSPGSGKTSLIEALLAPRSPSPLAAPLAGARAAVIEADLDSRVDADRLEAAGIRAVQLRTGGFCHLDAAMTAAGLAELGFGDGLDAEPPGAGGAGAAPYELVMLENVGNLVCTAQVDPAAMVDLVLLSVPEGDDKPLKYPLAFTGADAVVLTKADYLAMGDFDPERFSANLRAAGSGAPVFTLSARTGQGVEELASWLAGRLRAARSRAPMTARPIGT